MPGEEHEPRPGYVAVGRVARPWGLHGDVKVVPLSDFPDRFAAGAQLTVGGVERTVERSRSQRGDLFLKLSGIDDPDEAEALRGLLLEVPEAELHALPEGDYYHFQLQGLTVRTTAGESLGEVVEVLEPGGNPVLVVRGGRGEVLIPFIEDVIRRVELDARAVEVELMEGMLPDERAARRESRPAGRRHRRQRAGPHPGGGRAE